MVSPEDRIELSFGSFSNYEGTMTRPVDFCGDFNEVLSQDEHCGHRVCPEAQIDAFRDCLMDCELMDLGFSSPKFTWCNRQDPQFHVKVHLDRDVVNGNFINIHDDYDVEHLTMTSLDHYVVLIFYLGYLR